MKLQTQTSTVFHQLTESQDEVQNIMPQDFREIFDQSTGSDSDGDNMERNPQRSSQESIIFDEEYEIFTQPPLLVKKSCVMSCPFCYKYVEPDQEQLLYNSFLDEYFQVHRGCCGKFQAKNIGFKLHTFSQQEFLKCQSNIHDVLKLEPTLVTLDEVRVFIELKVFHPISALPLISMNHSVCLQHKRQSNDGIVQLDVGLLEMQSRLYQPKKIYIPFLEGRITADIYIFDPLQNHKNKYQVNFFYYVSRTSGKVILNTPDNNITMKGIVEEMNAADILQETSYTIHQNLLGVERIPILNLKSLSFTFPDLLKNRNLYVPSTQRCNAGDPQMFQPTPKTQPMTPQVTDLFVSRTRLPSFNLNEEARPVSPDLKIEEAWSEDISSIEQIRGNIAQIAKTQQGSRLIQKFFNTCTQSDVDVIIREVEDQIPDLMIDPYANYLFGSLSQNCVPSQRLHILRIICPRLVEIACDKKGTHAVQGLVSLISSRQEEELIQQAIQYDIVTLVLDSQGTHLIKKIISRFSVEKLGFIFDSLMEYFLDIVNHQYGLCVLKDLMSKFKSHQERSQLILKKIMFYLDEIIQDPYGNYAIQHALDLYGDVNCGCIIERVLQKIVQLSIHKYSSNVVEKCIIETSYVHQFQKLLKQTKQKFIQVLCREDVNLELMKNKFGSFVLQKALTMDKLNNRQLFLSLNKNVPQLYAMNIRQKWQDYLDNLSTRKVLY